MSDDSMKDAGLDRGDVALVGLGKRPKDGDLCVAFTATGRLVVRRYRRLPNRRIELTREPQRGKIQVFAPRAVFIFGPVVGIEKGG
jgi:SOS-response transcriptional repressor LexA